MSYALFIHPKCQREINKACKKNPLLKKILKRKIRERRVHILKSFVLKFKIDEPNKTIIFLAFKHHDKVYSS